MACWPSRPRLRDVGVAVEGDLGQGGEREPLDRPLAGLVGEPAHLLHLVRSGRQLPQPPRRAGRLEAPLERRLELERAQE